MLATEIELKLPQVDIDDARRRLTDAGAELVQPMRMMRRVNMEAVHHREIHAFLRIRDEGDKTTLAYKQRSEYDASTVDGVREVEVTVGDFDATVEIFRLSGLPPVTYQETRRETWQLGDVEVVIDEWPWIKPFIELEGPSVERLHDVIAALGYDVADAVACQIDQLYLLEYNFSDDARGLISVPDVRFDAPLPKQLTPKES